MYPLVLCTLLVSLLSLFSSLLPDSQTLSEESYKDSLAINFCVYRTAVAHHVETTEHVQNISNANLDLPPGFVFLRQWQTRIIGDYCYIYGEVQDDEAYIIRKKMGNSLLIGENRNGTMYPSGITVPQSIPNTAIVSIVSLP